MSCLEFRRAAMIDPRRLDPQARAHAEGCAACGELLARTLEHDDRLAEALRVPLPAGFVEHALRNARQQPKSRRWLALAASVVLAIALAAVLAWPRNDPLALAGIDFVVFEEAQSIVDARPTDMQVLAGVARNMGVSLPEQLGEINYVCVYPFAGGAAHHALVKTPLGKVTLLLIPGRPLASRAAASARGLEAAIMPVRGGAVAIVSPSARAIARIETLLGSS